MSPSRFDAATENGSQTLVAEPTGCVVRIVDGVPDDVGRYVHLGRGHVVIGSATTCDLRLNDRRVSRQHAELSISEKGVRVRDLASTNGTFYLGTRIESALVPVGARLRLGNTTIALMDPRETTDSEGRASYGDLIGESQAMTGLYASLERLEATRAAVLLLGETGTGKELVARAIHAHGPDRHAVMHTVDCGAIAPGLIDSELFGHVAGAFSGALAKRRGAFEAADEGTLFLDEIGELPLASQTRLLRALDTGEIKPVGADEMRRVRVRVIAATHVDLAGAVREKRFREDLYHRLAVAVVKVPPLRERLGDVPLLVEHFAQRLGVSDEGRVRLLIDAVAGHKWPGNVRELRNAVERLVTLGSGNGLQGQPGRMASDATATATDVDTSLPLHEARAYHVDRFEAAYLTSLLEAHNNNISSAARAAGVARNTLKELLRKHGLGRSR